jgi:hypothetical protein
MVGFVSIIETFCNSDLFGAQASLRVGFRPARNAFA